MSIVGQTFCQKISNKHGENQFLRIRVDFYNLQVHNLCSGKYSGSGYGPKNYQQGRQLEKNSLERALSLA